MSQTSLPDASSPLATAVLRRNFPLLLKRMGRLMEISSQLTSTLELPRLLRLIVNAAVELTETEAASIILLDPTSGDLRFEATTNIESAALEGLIIPREGSIAGWIFTHAEPLVVPDTRQDARWNPGVDESTNFVTRSILGVPLVARGKAIGVLEAINKHEGTFTTDDITTLHSLAAQAAIAIVNARLFQQSDLIAEMVHELRTPLSSLTAATHLLLRPELAEAQRQEIIRTMQRETARLTQMTTNFLEVARLESGRTRFKIEPFDLPALVQECVDVVRPQAGERGISIENRVGPASLVLNSDREKIKQVILNLLTNAVKYNRPQGSIRIELELDGRRCRLNVSDTGRGIPAQAMVHVFEKFYRVPDSEASATGTGLGLPIAKKIVEALGGEMGVRSTVDVGSTFFFTLPSG